MTDPINLEAVAWRIQMLDDTWEATTSLEAAQSYIDNGYVVEALGPLPAVSVEEVARSHWDSERETLLDRSGGAFDAGPWEEADPGTRHTRLQAASRITELFKRKA